MGSVEELRRSALERGIPIMMDDGIEFLEKYILEHGIKRILEIGTAVGYSAIRMALVSPDINVVSIERDEERYLEALDNIRDFGLDDRIEVLFCDALEASVPFEFDLIFIDGAKAQSIKFFERYEGNLTDGGVIITDNLNFHGLISASDIKSKNLRALVRKINNYREFLKNNEKYLTKFYEIGDGLSISEKK